MAANYDSTRDLVGAAYAQRVPDHSGADSRCRACGFTYVCGTKGCPGRIHKIIRTGERFCSVGGLHGGAK